MRIHSVIVASTAASSLFMTGCGIHSAAGTPVPHHVHPKTAATAAPRASSSSAGPSTPASESSAPSRTPSSGTQAQSLIRAWMQSGSVGEGPGMPIGDGKTIGAVQREWGRGVVTSAGAGLYFSYPAHKVAFGVGVGDQIFDVRSTQPQLQAITRTLLVKTLGAPGAIRYADDTTIYLYPDGANYQVLWVFPGGPGHTQNRVNHVDVFWPQGTVNLMGQNVPNPSIQVTRPAGRFGSYLGFAIINAPKGYQLAELEWIPSQSTAEPVVNTLPQALQHAAQHTPGAVFAAAAGGYRLQYTPAMQHQTGVVRLIYQNALGAAIIGSSATMRLP